MCDIGVLDTGVLVGFTIKHDQHHQTTQLYILQADRDCLYLPPRAEQEFKQASQYIRTELKSEIQTHRNSVQTEMHGQHQLDDSAIRYIRDTVIPSDDLNRADAVLNRYYTNQLNTSGVLMLTNLIRDLSNMETEVQKDQSKQHGGWRTHIDTWDQETDSYPQLATSLLIPPSTDLDILLESHHIASVESTSDVEFATVDASHFVNKHEGESRSRADDICAQTNLCNVRNVVNPI